MQIILTNSIYGGDFLDFAFQTNYELDILSTSSTAVVISNPDTGAITTITGTGFVFDPEDGFVSGTIDGWTTDDFSAQRIVTVTWISWSVPDFVTAIDALYEDDNDGPLTALLSLQPVTVDASAYQQGAMIFADGITSPFTFFGSAFGDQFEGGISNDFVFISDNVIDGDEIYASPGDDVYFFPANMNADSYVDLVYEYLNGPITVAIDGTADMATITKLGQGTDTLVGIQDMIDWDTSSLAIWGTNSNDTYTVDGGLESWIRLAGGAGQDSYNLTLSGDIRLTLGVGWEFGGTSGVDVDISSGTIYDDGFGNSEVLNITDQGRRLELETHNGNDSVIGSDRNESFILRGGDDTLDGGDGFDRLRFDRTDHTTGVIVDLVAGTATGEFRGTVFTKFISGIEHIRGSQMQDFFQGTAVDERFEGNNGDDTLIGGGGADTLEGGSGFDLASYEGSGAGVNVSLASGYAAGGDAVGDVFYSIEGLIGSSLADVLSGDSSANLLEGGESDDVLRGRDGADTLNGGAGSDWASYSDSTGPVNVSLASGYVAGAHAVGDVFISIENLQGSNHADTLNGDSGDNILEGGAGADRLVGNGGLDLASYDGSNAGVNVSLASGYVAGGHAAGDVLISIEGLIGSSHADLLSGDGQANMLKGGAGDDLLRGRDGADTLDGGTGSDWASYSDSTGPVNVSLATGYVAGAHAVGDVFISIENLQGSNHADTLNGDSSDNILEGGAGADRLVGNGGLDLASYDNSNAGVNVSLASGYAAGGHALGDVFVSIEGLVGSSHADLLSGDGLANMLKGGEGDDLLRGRAGADTLDGGAGEDWASYSDSTGAVNVSLATGYAAGAHAVGDVFISIEHLQGSSFADRLNGNSGDNILEGLGGADVLNGYGGFDLVSYQSSNVGVNVSLATGYVAGGHAVGDQFLSIEGLIGSAHADTLSGDSSENHIEGGAGNDMLRGYSGADVFVFGNGFGNDSVLDFANGSDLFDFGSHAGVSEFADLTITDVGANAVISDGLGNSITVNNAAGLIEISDFLF